MAIQSTSTRSGTLRHRITIERAVPTTSDSGAVSNTWEKVCDLRASIEPTGGTEVLLSGAYVPEGNFLIEARFFPGLNSLMRVNWKSRGRLLNILNINNYQERGIWMTILAQEGPGRRGIV